jgi:ferredoxin--NADP+ reductase
MDAPGSEGNPLQVAVVGSGPSGFYAAEALLKSGRTVDVDLIERLPAPFGLVRYGVAPDHPKLKEAILTYQVIARLPRFAFLGNVRVGRDVTVDELLAHYHAVVFACGAEADRRLGVPGEELAGSHTATEFVAWYNGHPEYRDRHFDLSAEVVAVVGQGNVAADVCRILAKSVDELRDTDIAEHALEALAASRVREIHVIGRRGPAQAKFTNKELKELGDLAHCAAQVDPGALELNAESLKELEAKTNFISAKNVEILRDFASRAPGAKPRRLIFHFLKSPAGLVGAGRLQEVVLVRNRLEGAPFEQVARETGQTETLACQLLFRSIGYSGVPVPGLPFDARRRDHSAPVCGRMDQARTHRDHRHQPRRQRGQHQVAARGCAGASAGLPPRLPGDRAAAAVARRATGELRRLGRDRRRGGRARPAQGQAAREVHARGGDAGLFRARRADGAVSAGTIMSETMILIGGRSSSQGTSLCAGKLGAEYVDVSSTLEMNVEDMARLGLKDNDRVRVRSATGEIVVRCKGRAAKDLPSGLLFIAYGPLSSALMDGDTAGSGMPLSKNIDVQIEPAA